MKNKDLTDKELEILIEEGLTDDERRIRELSNPKSLYIKLKEYSYTCSDGCCTDYGITTELNGEELPLHNSDTYTIVKQILENLGYVVEIEETYVTNI